MKKAKSLKDKQLPAPVEAVTPLVHQMKILWVLKGPEEQAVNPNLRKDTVQDLQT